MPWLTFDGAGPPSTDLDDLGGTAYPDEIECGENNKFWVMARRKKREMVLVDKVTGKPLHSLSVDERGFARMARSFGVGPRQIGAVKAAMELKNVGT